MNMKRIILTIIIACTVTLASVAQMDRRVQNKPYIDLRQLHFGILIGLNMQDIEFENVGLQTITDEDGTVHDELILCDADKWNPGFTVGVLGEWRLSDNFSLRFTPQMHFGAKHLTFMNTKIVDENGVMYTQTQDLKNTYVSLPIDLKFAAPRWNNHRPYIMAGINPMMNLTGSESDIVRLKRFNTMFEIGLGCDFYLPFFKLIPELKFCFGLSLLKLFKVYDHFSDEDGCFAVLVYRNGFAVKVRLILQLGHIGMRVATQYQVNVARTMYHVLVILTAVVLPAEV